MDSDPDIEIVDKIDKDSGMVRILFYVGFLFDTRRVNTCGVDTKFLVCSIYYFLGI